MRKPCLRRYVPFYWYCSLVLQTLALHFIYGEIGGSGSQGHVGERWVHARRGRIQGPDRVPTSYISKWLMH